YKTASAITVCEIFPCFTGAACTDTIGGGSACCFEQAASGRKLNTANPRIECTSRRVAIELEDPCQSLQISDGQPVSSFAVLIIVASQNQRILRVHYFKSCGLPTLIAQTRQTNTLRSQIGRLLKQIELHPCRFRLRVQCLQV